MTDYEYDDSVHSIVYIRVRIIHVHTGFLNINTLTRYPIT